MKQSPTPNLFPIATYGLLAIIALAGCARDQRQSPAQQTVSEVITSPENAAELSFAGLDEAKQKQIWDLEHLTFELEHKFGRAFVAALKNRDREALAAFFQDPITGSILSADSCVKSVTPQWEEKVLTASDVIPPEGSLADRKAVVHALIDALKDFDEISGARLRVLSIAADDAAAEQWRLTLLITANGKSAAGSPISFESHHNVVCQFADEKEIETGRIVSAWRVLDEITRSAPSPFMEEVTEQVELDKLNLTDNWSEGLQPLQYRFQMAVDDFNRDGFPDLAVCCIEGRQDLLLSVNGTSFHNATLEVGIPPIHSSQETYLASAFDFDNDGYTDLLLGASLYRNVNGKRFEDVTAKSRLQFRGGSMGCIVADYDRDGLLDIYMLYQGGTSQKTKRKPSYVDDNQSGLPNQLWRNIGGGEFEDVTAAAGVGGGNRRSFAAAWLHANDDLLPDLYVANDFGTNQLFLNRGDRFEDVTSSAAVGDYATSMGVATGDINGDGRPEIYVANMYSKMGRRIIEHVGEDDYPPGLYAQIKGSCAGNRLYGQTPDASHYQENSVALGINDVGWAYAPVLVDFDSDGFLDIYATTGFLSFDRKKPDG